MINEPTPLELSENLVRRPLVMTIGGFDPSGAGLQADIETCSALGVHALPIVTAVTIQNTKSIERILPLAADDVSAQITHLLADVAKPSVCKIGMLPNREVLHAVIDTLNRWLSDIPIVLDPILKSTSGTTFVDPVMLATLRNWLSRITLLRPNADEACTITDQPELTRAGEALSKQSEEYERAARDEPKIKR